MILLIHEITLLLTTNPLHILMQKLLKSMINCCVNPRYIQQFRPTVAIAIVSNKMTL